MGSDTGASRSTASSSPKADYVPVLELSRGGMGMVWLVLRTEGRFRRLFALKRPYPHFRDEPQFRDMFLEEARIAGLIHHPNVVATHDVGEDEMGPYFVMDYVEGVSVTALVSSLSRNNELLPIQLALSIGIDAARGLAAAHELRGHDGADVGLIHRDVTPGNLLIGFDGITRVTDFGIAKALDGMARTRTGLLKGKQGYMAPEQLNYLPATQGSDLFSFGVVLFEILTAQRLYRQEGSDSVPRRILDEPPPDLADHRTDAPKELVALMFRLLAKEPKTRPASAAAVVRELEVIRSKLVVAEGAVDLTEYMRERFSTTREREKTRVSAAIAEALPDGPTSVGAMSGESEDAEPPSVPELPHRSPVVDDIPVPRPRWRPALVISLALGLAAVAAWWSFGSRIGISDQEPRVERTAPTPTKPSATQAAPNVAAVEAKQPSVADAGSVEAAEHSDSAPKDRSRRSRVRSNRGKGKGSSTDDRWQW